MPINKTHTLSDRGLDAYFTPSVAVWALLALEEEYLPEVIHEPACGNGGIASHFEAAGYTVHCSDVQDYGYPGTRIANFLESPPIGNVEEGIVTNPPFRYAKEFCEKSVKESNYVAMLARLQYLESVARMEWLTLHPPTRILIPSRRLPMMHRQGWEGNEASSNMCHPWFIWDGKARNNGLTEIVHYDWHSYKHND